MDISEKINDSIQILGQVNNIIALNDALVRQELDNLKKIFSLNDERNTLNEVLKLIKLREATIKMLEHFSEIDDQEEIEYQNHKIKFLHARLFAIEAFLTCSWSIYDILTGCCGCFVSGDSFADRDSNKNFAFNKLFIREKNSNSNISPHLLVELFTKNYGLEIEYFYLLRNKFVHELGYEITDTFISTKSGDACFQLTENARLSFQRKIDPNINQHNHPLLENNDLLEVFKVCVGKTDEAFCILLDASMNLYSSLIRSIILSKGGRLQ